MSKLHLNRRMIMNSFQPITPESISDNTFRAIGKDWFLVTAQTGGVANTMTASWGGFGIMWGKPVVFVVVRESRYTKEFMDKENAFSLSFFPSKYKKMLSYLGSASGRDEDKIKIAGLTLIEDDIPYFKEARLVLKAKTLYKQEMSPNCFLDPALPNRWYPNGNYHTMYVAEITETLEK